MSLIISIKEIIEHLKRQTTKLQHMLV